MISRRELLLAAVSTALLPGRIMASAGNKSIAWSEFQTEMTALAAAQAGGSINQQHLANTGMQHLKQLDIGSAEFKRAVEESYETGNRYWLWQRMIKGRNINGGI